MPPPEEPLPTYHERYCAFVDIIGFRELIAQLGQGTTSFQSLRSILRIIHDPPTMKSKVVFGESDLRAQSISDAVCISTSRSGDGLGHLFYALRHLTFNMLEQGFFIRGAVVKGNLYHDDSMVFGEAFVRAYQLETEIVRYPRIMVASEVAADIHGVKGNYFYAEALAGAVAQSDDGPRFLDVLADIVEDFTHDEPEKIVELGVRCDEMAGQIQRRYDASFDNPRHFEKVQWFARYWNRTVTRFGVKAILRQGAEGGTEVYV